VLVICGSVMHLINVVFFFCFVSVSNLWLVVVNVKLKI